MRTRGTPLDATEVTLHASRALLGIAVRSIADALQQVTLPQLGILAVLAKSGPTRMSDLATRVGALPSTFTRTIDRLVRGGWVVRDRSTQKRREILVELTEEGRQLVEHVFEDRRRQIALVLASLRTDEQRQVINALELFSTAASELTLEEMLEFLGASVRG